MNALAQAVQKTRPKLRQKPDKRRHARIKIRITGRFLFEETDHQVRTVNVSCGGALLTAETVPPKGTPIVCYFDDLGRIAAEVVRHDGANFAVRFQTTAHKRDKLADRLMWLLNQGRFDLKDERSAPRKASASEAAIVLPNGTKVRCRVIDISLTGAAFEQPGMTLPIGMIIQAGTIHGEVVRSDTEGFAIRFLRPDER